MIIKQEDIERHFPDEEYARLLRFCVEHQHDPKWEHIVFTTLFFAFTGVRLNEMRNLEVADCLPLSINIKRGKGGKRRGVEIAPEFRLCYERWLCRAREKNWKYLIQVGPKRPAERTIRYWMNYVAEGAGVRRFSPKFLRSNMVTWEGVLGRMNMVAIQAQMGHTDIATTSRYYLQSPLGTRFREETGDGRFITPELQWVQVAQKLSEVPE